MDGQYEVSCGQAPERKCFDHKRLWMITADSNESVFGDLKPNRIVRDPLRENYSEAR